MIGRHVSLGKNTKLPTTLEPDVPMVQILHEVDLGFQRVEVLLNSVPEADLLHSEQLSRRLVQAFEHLVPRNLEQIETQ